MARSKPSDSSLRLDVSGDSPLELSEARPTPADTSADAVVAVTCGAAGAVRFGRHVRRAFSHMIHLLPPVGDEQVYLPQHPYAMPLEPALDDDYVASLLKRDAEATNKSRYLTSGLGSLLSRKPKGNAPKPNTRFLRNIIRETDGHNAALKAKEEAESRARLRELRSEEKGGKRRRKDEHEDGRAGKRMRGKDRPDRWAKAFGGLGRSEERQERKHDDGKDEGRSRHHSGHSRHDQSSREERHDRHRHPRKDLETRVQPRTTSPEHRTKRRRRSSSSAEDSDPLHPIIGPSPPPTTRPRGRGAGSSTQSMDTRFRPDYDPKTDVSLEQNEDEDDDWNSALEALRDRTKWRQQGAERLKAAGFTDEEVATWEGGGKGEKGVEDVRWRKEGEGREWDRGKVVADGDR